MIKKKKFMINIHYDNEVLLLYACSQNNLEFAKWLHSLDNNFDMSAKERNNTGGNINEEYTENYIFIHACGVCSLEIVKWLYSLNENVNIHTNANDAFFFACYNEHLDVAQWLMEIAIKKNTQDNFDISQIFCVVCLIAKLEMVKWLYEMSIKLNKQIITSDISYEEIASSNMKYIKENIEWMLKIFPNDKNVEKYAKYL